MVRNICIAVALPIVLMGSLAPVSVKADDEFSDAWRRIADEDPFPEDPPPPAELFVAPAPNIRVDDAPPAPFASPSDDSAPNLIQSAPSFQPPPPPAPGLKPAPVQDLTQQPFQRPASRVDLDQAAAAAAPSRGSQTVSSATSTLTRTVQGPAIAYAGQSENGRWGVYDPHGTLPRFATPCRCQDVWCGYENERAARYAKHESRMHGTCQMPPRKHAGEHCQSSPVLHGGGRVMPCVAPLCTVKNPWCCPETPATPCEAPATSGGGSWDPMPAADPPSANGDLVPEPHVAPEAASLQPAWSLPPPQVAALGLPVSPPNVPAVQAR
jgi:hypothetical protein